MFLRQIGRQVMLLRSYRDGAGRVRQRCLGKFRSRVGLERDWEKILVTEPGLKSELLQMKQSASELVAKIEPECRDIEARIAFHTNSLLRLLADYEGQIPEMGYLREKLQLIEEGDQRQFGADEDHEGHFDSDEFCQNNLVSQTTILQSVIKTKFLESGESSISNSRVFETHSYREALDAISANTNEEKVRKQAERARVWPDLQGLTDYALALGKSGRIQECIDTLYRLPGGDAWANLNRAAVFWQLEEPLLTLQHVLKGLAKEVQFLSALEALQKGRHPVKGLRYWQKYGYLWDETARHFLLKIYKQPLVKLRLRSVAEGHRARTLVHPYFQPRLLQKIQAQ